MTQPPSDDRAAETRMAEIQASLQVTDERAAAWLVLANNENYLAWDQCRPEMLDLLSDRATLLSHLATLQEQQAAQAAELLSLARAYDPNCDEYHYDEQLAAMKAARETVEAMQELATYLGRDPEGCLTDVPDEAMGKIEELEAELERVKGELRDDYRKAAEAEAQAGDEARQELAAERERAERAEGELAKMRECCEQGQGRANNFLAGLKTGPVFVMVHALRQDFDEALGKDFSVDPTPTPAATEGE